MAKDLPIMFNNLPVDLYQLYLHVTTRGGFRKVCAHVCVNRWWSRLRGGWALMCAVEPYCPSWSRPASV